MIRSLLVLAASAFVLVGCDSRPEDLSQRAEDAVGPSYTPPPPLPGQIVRFKAGTQLPELTFSDPSGAQLNTADLKGTPVVLNLWATWCAPCVIEMPTLDALGTELDGEVKVLTVSQDVRGAEVVAPFFAQREFANLEQWLDPDAQLNQALNPEGLMPVTILFDADGKELLRVAGGYEWDSEEAIAAIREALAE
ncbi:TlpA family protein disulfide reductase [Erythrobacter crassostreae]|uniref:TlpA family protein disulfide reductase n=1 Tax=Erythrobacter crassostreae TaxID=2828328 RepID=A0A9X1JMG1_9SPHN|nr:TlpA disulfide reductase family protein [Erythrobacter crassostrea]MBV7259389.1 TlpA family protein disulfide reductase [Erythrobacter crassostrea]